MDAPIKSGSFGSKNCKTRSLHEGKKRPHLFNSTMTTTDDGVVTESRICSWCGTTKWTAVKD